ncbi:MAG TPA: hypothetical protein VIZ28_01205 [Chitinophagaceae bacterium]
MASKKYTLLLTGFFCLLFSSVFSQNQQKRSYEDSSVIPAKRMPQHTEFINGTSNFPAKPRNQWEIGIKLGTMTVSSDIPAVFPTGAFGIQVRKALGYVFSLRLEYMNGTGTGLHYRWSENYGKNTPWVAAGYTPNSPDFVFYNYKTKVQDLSIQGIINLNNIRFHTAKTKLSIYGIVGLGGSVYETKVNALDENDQPYPFSSIPQGAFEDRKDTKKAIRDMLDDSYESDAQNHGDRRPKLFGGTFKPSGTVGAGLAFKLSNKINLAIEDRVVLLKDDLLDGQQWQEQPYGDAALTSDVDTYNYLTIGLNLNLGSKAVEPLWWLNPLEYAYAELRNPKLMNIPKPVLPDADGDGVTDQFDLEQTPAGVPVDTHGVSRDTDGDGVPDSKDKELVTPTYCQPVDADGVGKCPCPDKSCFPEPPPPPDCASKLGALPSVSFKSSSNALTDDAKAVLATVASALRNSPECKLVVIGYCASDKKQQQLSWDHVNKVITHLVEKEGINADRFIFKYGEEGGDCNTVDLRGAGEGEEGPNTVAPPHPNLRKK